MTVPLHSSRLLCIHTTDVLTHWALLRQVFMYVAGAQLLFSAPRSSIPAGLCGILAGIAYHSNVLGMKRLQVGSAMPACHRHSQAFFPHGRLLYLCCLVEQISIGV